jgi:hypothetical protein
MGIYTVELTEAEEIAMQYIAADVNEWIQNAAHARANIAMSEIVKIAVEKSLAIGQSIPGSREEIVSLASNNGWLVKETPNISNNLNDVPMI